jgi:hypothetical protein
MGKQSTICPFCKGVYEAESTEGKNMRAHPKTTAEWLAYFSNRTQDLGNAELCAAIEFLLERLEQVTTPDCSQCYFDPKQVRELTAKLASAQLLISKAHRLMSMGAPSMARDALESIGTDCLDSIRAEDRRKIDTLTVALKNARTRMMRYGERKQEIDEIDAALAGSTAALEAHVQDKDTIIASLTAALESIKHRTDFLLFTPQESFEAVLRDKFNAIRNDCDAALSIGAEALQSHDAQIDAAKDTEIERLKAENALLQHSVEVYQGGTQGQEIERLKADNHAYELIHELDNRDLERMRLEAAQIAVNARREALMEATKAQCELCREGVDAYVCIYTYVPNYGEHTPGDYMHTKDYTSYACDASNVHKLMADAGDQTYDNARREEPAGIRYVITADGEGAMVSLVGDEEIHEALHKFMCVCGRGWRDCSSKGTTSDIAMIDDPDNWSFDEDGNQFSVRWDYETGRTTLYRRMADAGDAAIRKAHDALARAEMQDGIYDKPDSTIRGKGGK